MAQAFAGALRVVVAGAGIGGLTAAVALQRHGFDVHVYERAEELGEVGAGLQLGPNAVKVVRALGLESEVLALASEPSERISLEWNTGRLRHSEAFRGRLDQLYGAPYLTLHRADLHRLLLAQLPASRVHTGVACESAGSHRGVSFLRLAGGMEAEADVVIGADGIHSSVRKAMFGEETVRFTNQICWRLILPMEELLRMRPRFEFPFTGDEYAGWIGPTGHVIHYPLRGGELLNIFAGRVSSEWVGENWTVPSGVDEMLRAYEGWNEGLLELMGRARSTHKWGIHDRDPFDRWSQGGVTLLGDAAHPMMPTLAQGAAMAMEDGYAIARHLKALAHDPCGALAAYEAERRPRASAVQLQARQQFINNQKVPAPPNLPVDWIYGHDATAGHSVPA